LTVLSLIDNPITDKPNYPEIVLRNLPRLTILDEIDVFARQSGQTEAQLRLSRLVAAQKNAHPDLAEEGKVLGESKQQAIEEENLKTTKGRECDT
jgi:hypothetical protein